MKELLQQLTITLKEIVWSIEDFLWVETKDSRVIPFKLNNKQQQVIRDIEKTKKPIRIIILKGRQFGVSTLILAIFFIKCLLVKNTRAVVIAHDIDATRKLFRKVRFFANTLIIKPVLDKENEREYSFPTTNSYFYIGTAGSRSFGRGDNITDLHCSEVAFWEQAGIVMNGLLQAVGMTGNVFVESTANGYGGNGAYFAKLWKKAIEGTWSGYFYKWTDFDEYEMDIDDDWEITIEEKQLIEQYPELTEKKLAWRRWKIAETEGAIGLSPLQIFKQEYPLSAKEAFITSGNCIFNIDSLLNYETSIGKIIEDGLIIWTDKIPDYSIMGVDVSEGLTLETVFDETIINNHDAHSIEILDKDLNQIAEWTGYIDTDLLAEFITKLADRYHSFVGVESNGPGLAVLSPLKKLMPISKLYHREVYDVNYKTTTKKLGWSTNNKTKHLMLNEMVGLVREHKTIINSSSLIQECLSTVRDENGDINTNGKDRLMAYAVALQMYKFKPPLNLNITPEEQQKKEKEREWQIKRKLRQIKKLRQFN